MQTADATQTTTTARAQTIARCRNGHIVKGSWDDAGRSGGWLVCGCGARGIAKGLDVTIKKDTRCGARCTSALGAVCACSCGGEAHGEDHRF